MAEDLKDTLNLPKTEFPMRANLVKREPEWIQKRHEANLYQAIQEKNKDGVPYILHDGPPFTNGDVHIGTALNKILKDITLRYKSMRGHRTPYVPGWDCHGLPIEHKVMKTLQGEGESLDGITIREACNTFSEDYIKIQRKQFERLGVLADWDAEYKTKDPAYEADILRNFSKFVEAGLVYRSKKPVYWSIPCETALAEAEIEYKDHVSPSIWVEFPIIESGSETLNASVVIWTTTPWTLPSNQAIAVHPELTYVLVEHADKRYLIAEALAGTFVKDCELEGATYGKIFTGKDLEGWATQHPFIERKSPIILADFVTTEAGTGCVHCAPGHGPDDYIVGKKYDLPIYCPLSDEACYIDDGEVPKSLIGVSVAEQKGGNRANKGVIELLKENEALLHFERLKHSYPFCWRSKTPAIYRAMDQWFVALDKNGTRDKVLEKIKDVEWLPGWGETRIHASVTNRPDWCISRQRSWGVPLPIFYDEEKEAYLDTGVINALADKIEQYGTDIWFSQTAEELLADISIPESWKGKKLTPGIDTLDVWIDSGSSHTAVLKRRPQLSWPADLYLEGSDQHRGWFQSSLWAGVIAEGNSPYKKVVTHGFIVDENRRKISKSGKKPQTADMYVSQFGADIIRLWIASEEYLNDIPLSEGLIKQVTQTYRTLRNTLRFQLGNLYDFDPNKDAVAPGEFTEIDQWALKQTATFLSEVTAAYERIAYHRVYQLINRFCSVELSAIYHDILKDRLYTYGPTWKERRSSQTAIHTILNILSRVLAPILTFTADEAHAYAAEGVDYTKDSIHLQDWPELDPKFYDKKTVAEMDTLIALRARVNEKLEAARQSKILGQSLDAQVIISGPEESTLIQLLKKHEELLPELFIVSNVVIHATQGKSLPLDAQEAANALSAEVKQASGERCPHSWRWVPELVPAEGYPGVNVSPRSQKALLDRNNQ